MNAEDLIGAWRLADFTMRNSSGAVNAMAGWEKRGLLLYTADGHMSATLFLRETPLRFHSDQLSAGSEAEKIAAFEAHTAYCGRYTVSGDTIFHDVEISLFPNWNGTRQRRAARLTGDALVLTSPTMAMNDGDWILEATWRRCAPSPGSPSLA